MELVVFSLRSGAEEKRCSPAGLRNPKHNVDVQMGAREKRDDQLKSEQPAGVNEAANPTTHKPTFKRTQKILVIVVSCVGAVVIFCCIGGICFLLFYRQTGHDAEQRTVRPAAQRTAARPRPTRSSTTSS
ncbi:hypothetical protein M3Y99_00463500 [Aphelenchoides fujianensis]|nr:hypothetical protein M3Y99_00463500 [Aphelenchoides fujianensis]